MHRRGQDGVSREDRPAAEQDGSAKGQGEGAGGNVYRERQQLPANGEVSRRERGKHSEKDMQDNKTANERGIYNVPAKPGKVRGNELDIARDYLVYGLSLKKIAKRRRATYYRVRKVMMKIQEIVRVGERLKNPKH